MAYQLDRTGDNVANLLTQVEEKTIYPDATQEAHGLLSAADKAKLDALPDVVYGTTAYWNSQPTYVPPAGRVVVYSDYSSKIVDGQTVYIPALKVGTGLAFVQELPFVGDVSIYGLGEAAYRDVAATVSQGSTKLPTGGAVHTAIGNAKSELEQEITSVAGDVSEINTKLTNDEGDIADLKLTAQGLQLDVRSAQGDITDLQVDARGIHSDIRNINDDVTALDVRAGRLEVDMTNAQGDIHNLTVTTGELTSDISAVDGRVSTLKQTVDEISATVGNQQQDIAGLDVRAGEIELYAQGVAEDLGEYEDYMTGVLANMEKQIDGAIDTWFYDYAPVHTTQGVPDSTVPLMVVPYSDWYNADQQDPEHPEKIREEHVGDIFYDNTSGYAYRFVASGNAGSRVYAWSVITDSAVVKALADAARAQDTADHKRRVFVYSQQYPTPYAPYDVGDLWVKNVEVYVPPRGSAIIGTTINTRILYKCKTARSRTSDTFPYNPAVNTDTSSAGCDWEPANDNPLEIANANLQLLSDAIVGKVGAYTYDANGVLTTNSQSLIQQQAHSIILEVTGDELDTVGIYINNASQSDNNITLQAGKIFFQGAESQNHKTAMSFIWDPNAGQNGDWKITAANLDVNGIFSTSAWDAEELALKNYAESEADDAESAAKTYAEGEADSAEAAAKAYAKEYADNVGSDSVTSAETYFNNIVYGNGGSAEHPTSGSILYTLNNFDVELNDPTTGLAAQVTAIDQGLTDLGYLAEALFDGDTVVAGGLILSSLIQLGSKHDNSTGTDSPVDDTITQATWRVWSGLNGVYNSSAYGGGIAGWYGGAMLDRHYPDNTDLNRAAKTLFRFDGSGYLASNNIYWDAAGNLTINGYTLTNEIQLKDSSSNVTAGISGLYDNSTGSAAWGHGIAAWFGGPKVDKYAGSSVPASYAKSLFRMDGSGYLASGNISWGAAGEIAIHDVTLYDDNGQVSIAQILALCSWFSVEEYETNKFRLKVNLSESGLDGLYVGGYLISAGDQIVNSGTSGGGDSGAQYLYELNDVNNNLQNPATGTMIYWSGSEWVRTSSSSPANGNVLQYNNGAWGYVAASSIGGVTSVVGQTGDVTAAQIQSAIGLGNYVDVTSDQTVGGFKIVTGYIAFKMARDTSNYKATTWVNAANEIKIAEIGYHNTVQRVIINPIGSEDAWQDTEGMYNLVVGNNELKYNTKVIYHAGNFIAGTNYVAPSALNSYLPLSAGSGKALTDMLYLKANQYTDDGVSGALNLQNSNIIKVNAIYTSDLAETASEGIHFYRTSTTVDSLWAANGVLYFTPNRTLGSTATDRTVYHSGNFTPGDYLPLAGGTMTGLLDLARSTSGIRFSISNTGLYDALTYNETTNLQRIGIPFGTTTIRSGDTDLKHNKNGTDYVILDASNYTSYTPILNSAGTHATSSSVIYAPTSAGTQNYMLISNGSGAPSWTAQSNISAGYSIYSGTVYGSYTADGGQQNPDYFGKNRVGFLMMNTTVNGNSQFKDWVIMDCYVGNDAGGSVAFGVNRQSLGAYIMRSDAARTSWAASAELLGTHNYTSYALPRSGGSSYPMTGALYIKTGDGILDASGKTILAYHATDMDGVSSTQWGVGAADCQGVIRSSAVNLVHYRGGTSYDIADKYVLTNLNYDINRVVATGADGGYKITGTSYAMRFMIGSAGTNRGIYSDTSSAWMLYFDASNTILNYGNVGIGTTSPSYKLDVEGTAHVTGHFSVGKGLAQVTAGRAELSVVSAANVPTDIMMGAGGEKRWSITTRSSGDSYEFRLHYYGTGVNALRLTTGGTLTTTGDQTVSSDINLKENLAPVTYTIEDIAKTRAVTFDWKDGRGRSAGSIAQDWKPLIPELVHGEEGNMTLAYGQIALLNTVLLARHETEQDKEIRELKDKLFNAENRIKDLENRLKIC